MPNYSTHNEKESASILEEKLAIAHRIDKVRQRSSQSNEQHNISSVDECENSTQGENLTQGENPPSSMDRSILEEKLEIAHRIDKVHQRRSRAMQSSIIRDKEIGNPASTEDSSLMDERLAIDTAINEANQEWAKNIIDDDSLIQNPDKETDAIVAQTEAMKAYSRRMTNEKKEIPGSSDQGITARISNMVRQSREQCKARGHVTGGKEAITIDSNANQIDDYIATLEEDNDGNIIVSAVEIPVGNDSHNELPKEEELLDVVRKQVQEELRQGMEARRAMMLKVLSSVCGSLILIVLIITCVLISIQPRPPRSETTRKPNISVALPVTTVPAISILTTAAPTTQTSNPATSPTSPGQTTPSPTSPVPITPSPTSPVPITPSPTSSAPTTFNPTTTAPATHVPTTEAPVPRTILKFTTKRSLSFALNRYLSGNFSGPPIGDWDVSQVTDFRKLFCGHSEICEDDFNPNVAYFNEDISKWDTSSAIDMRAMFIGASSFNQDLSSWNTSKVTTMFAMFLGARSFNQDLSSWDTSRVTAMGSMFYNATTFNKPLSNWNTSAVTDMFAMFRDAHSFNQDISSWDTSKVTDMSDMFRSAEAFNSPLSNWDTSSVVTMNQMFLSAAVFNQDINNWDVSKVVDMGFMFFGAEQFNQNLCSWGRDIKSLDTNTFLMFLFSGCEIDDQPDKLASPPGPLCHACECGFHAFWC